VEPRGIDAVGGFTARLTDEPEAAMPISIFAVIELFVGSVAVTVTYGGDGMTVGAV
jgi:hypothetical protein